MAKLGTDVEIRVRRAWAGTRPFPATAATGSPCSEIWTVPVSESWFPAAGAKSQPGPPTSSGAFGGTAGLHDPHRGVQPEKGRYLHPSAHRPITVREAARCMSFPDDFILPEDQAMTSIARQIGNAVPPLLARRIAEALAEALDLSSSKFETEAPASRAA